MPFAYLLIAVCDDLVVWWLLDPAQTPTGEQLATALGVALNIGVKAA